ncbi:TyeA [compost metagenome]
MKWVSAERFNGLSERCGAHATEAKVHFLSGIKNLLREMPENVFLSSEQRQSVINASQEALDTAIDREEEEY